MDLDEFFEQMESEIKFSGFVNGVVGNRINTYNFDVNKIRRIVKTPESQVLKKNGENLHYILENLKHTEVVKNISADLTGVVELLEDIEIDMQPMGTDKVPEIFFELMCIIFTPVYDLKQFLVIHFFYLFLAIKIYQK